MIQCKQCNTGFEITDEDLRFYDKVSPVFGGKKYSIPPPTLCPDCRQQLRQSFRNERTLHKRDCDRCKRSMISVYEPGAKYTVYCQECYWGDGWSGLDYGVDFDFSRPFFGQFDDLRRRVPLVSLSNIRGENSDYCNQTGYLKNCYLCVNSIHSEDCFYSKGLSESKDCMDCLKVYGCELCYECVDCHHCYNGKYLQNCKNCQDSLYCFNCQNCSHCFGCAGLRNKEYYLFNEPCKPEEYEEKLGKILASQTPKQIQDKFKKVVLSTPHPATLSINAEGCSGDCIYDSKNVRDSYDVVGGENLKFCYDLRAKCDNSYDVTAVGNGISFSYQAISSGSNMTSGLFVDNCWEGVSNLTYCTLCVNNSLNCFGCVGLKHAQYAILNKVYSKEDYQRLSARIAEHMQKTGEWGQFFPSKLSTFPYNASLAQEYYPLTKAEVLAKGFGWSDYETPPSKVTRVITKDLMVKLPSRIEDVPDDILNWALTCEATGKLFKIIPQELEYYRKTHLPVPHFHPDERHRRRMALRNPRHLWPRNCAKCGIAVQTTYSPERPEIVYCESCYLKEVY